MANSHGTEMTPNQATDSTKPSEREELIVKALRRAFSLGQTYWQQSDSEYISHHVKANETLAKFSAFIDETVAALLADGKAGGEVDIAIEWAAGLAVAERPQSGDWLYDDREELAKAIRAGITRPQQAAQVAHSDDIAVDKFSVAMKEKLAAARAKGRGGWESCDPNDLRLMLREHVEKGDPRDVANFCMFLWNLGHGIGKDQAS